MFNKERVEVIDFAKETKRRKRKEKAKRIALDTIDFCKDNAGWLIPLTTTVGGVVTWGIKTGTKSKQQNRQQDLKELYCYDRSLGHYWELRRKLTNSEWVEIDKRKKNGERLADILDELKVLK